ncbi:MAG: hypothetical protein Q9219_000131 [cf. Caloplaca sp. 3 TL-2023]
MEADFPQVCPKCAPAVEDRIRSTGYAAKTDHLRRMMDRTRDVAITKHDWTLKRVAVTLGGLGWFAGHLGQFTWNALGTLPAMPVEGRLIDEEEHWNMIQCFIHSPSSSQSAGSSGCPALLHVASFLGLSLLCFWWNPRMQYKLQGGYGRIVGRLEYYKLQLTLMVIRYLSWKLTAKDSSIHLEPSAVRAVHAFNLVGGIILTFLSFNAIQIDRQPLVSFQEHYEPLVPSQPTYETRSTSIEQSRKDPILKRTRVQPFPIEKLAPKPQPPAYQPPTPPPEEDYDEGSQMEWTPQHHFRSPTSYRAPQPKPAYDGPSPFHGTIPPAPVSWAQRLRNPRQVVIQKAPEAKKENFFNKRSKRIISDTASDVTSPAPSVTCDSMLEMDSPVKFAQPKFFAPSDRMETGLESLFTNAFSLGEDQSSGDHQGQEGLRATGSSLTSKPLSRLLITLSLAASCMAWYYAPTLSPASPDLVRLNTMVVAGLSAVYNSALGLMYGGKTIAWSLITASEFLGAAIIIYGIHDADARHAPTQTRLDILGLAYLAALTVQEAWAFVSSFPATTPPSPSEESQQPAMDQQREAAPSAKPRPGNTTARPKPSSSSAISVGARSNRLELNQRTTRSRATNERRRDDSLGVDGFGSLSLDGW